MTTLDKLIGSLASITRDKPQAVHLDAISSAFQTYYLPTINENAQALVSVWGNSASDEELVQILRFIKEKGSDTPRYPNEKDAQMAINNADKVDINPDHNQYVEPTPQDFSPGAGNTTGDGNPLS